MRYMLYYVVYTFLLPCILQEFMLDESCENSRMIDLSCLFKLKLLSTGVHATSLFKEMHICLFIEAVICLAFIFSGTIVDSLYMSEYGSFMLLCFITCCQYFQNNFSVNHQLARSMVSDILLLCTMQNMIIWSNTNAPSFGLVFLC